MNQTIQTYQKPIPWKTVMFTGFLILAAPLWGQRSDPEPPENLEIARLVLIDARYDSATWDERAGQFTDVKGTALYALQGESRSKAGPTNYVPMSFENLTVQPAGSSLGQVTEGEVVFNAPPLQLDLSGFLFTLEVMTVDSEGATGSGWLKLPDNTVEAGSCGPPELYLDDLTFQANDGFYQVAPTTNFGTWLLSESGMEIQGTGFVADFSTAWSWNGWDPGNNPPPASWKGLVLLQGQTVSALTPPNSNTGYLQAPYAFQYGLIDNDGMNVTLELTGLFSFNPIQPWGYQVELTEGSLIMLNNKITDGAFHNGKVRLPWNAIRSFGGVAYANFSGLDVEPDLTLSGAVTVEKSVAWGEFGQSPASTYYWATVQLGPLAGHFYLPSQPFSPTYLPLDAADNFTDPNLFLTPENMMKTHDMQGVVVFPTYFETNSIDLLGPGSKELGFANDSWLHVGSNGVSGTVLVELDNAGMNLGDPANYPATSPFNTAFSLLPAVPAHLSFRFVDSALYQSDGEGDVTLPLPISNSLNFENLRFTSTAQIPGADIVLPGPIPMSHWGLELTGKPGASEAGVMSVRGGVIYLTAAGIAEPRHFTEPFWLLWGEILPTGQVGNLVFDFNNGNQEFDGFPYTTEAISLSEYDPQPVTPPFLEVGGTIHYPFFGAGYLHVIDEKHPDNGNPFNGRLIHLSTQANGDFEASELNISANWGNGTANLSYTLSYDDLEQDAFLGVGTVTTAFHDGSMGSTLDLQPHGGCLSIKEESRRDFTLGPIANFSSMGRINGCACIDGDIIELLSLTGELETQGNANIALRSAAYGFVEQTWTPSTSYVNVYGTMFLSLFIGADIQMSGNVDFLVDRDAGFTQGHINGNINTAAIFAGLEASGELDWYVGDYQALQGRLSLDIFAAEPSGVGAGVGTEGGFFVGIGTPKEKAWILQEADPEFELDITNLPEHLTGVYGYMENSASVSVGPLFSGGYRMHVGMGLFDSEVNQGTWPLFVGNMGVEIWGEILAGLLSAKAWGNFQLMLPHPAGFEGTVGLEACALWVICADVELTCGLNTAEGFYIR